MLYSKTQTLETEKTKTIKLSFHGASGLITADMSISGESEDIARFLQEHDLTKFGQRVNVEITNDQATLD